MSSFAIHFKVKCRHCGHFLALRKDCEFIQRKGNRYSFDTGKEATILRIRFPSVPKEALDHSQPTTNAYQWNPLSNNIDACKHLDCGNCKRTLGYFMDWVGSGTPYGNLVELEELIV